MSNSSKQVKKSIKMLPNGKLTPAKSTSNRNSNTLSSAIPNSARKEDQTKIDADTDLEAIELDLQQIKYRY